MASTLGFKNSATLEFRCPRCQTTQDIALADMFLYAMRNGTPIAVLPQCSNPACNTSSQIIAQPMEEANEGRFLELHMNRCLFVRLHASSKFDTEDEVLSTALDTFKDTQLSAYTARGDASRKAEFAADQIPADKVT